MAMKLLLVSALVSVSCDMKISSSPMKLFVTGDKEIRDTVREHVVYMEPSHFYYAGLKKQRDKGGYDNFLRSNIDNEQDKRNFEEEPGKDHLPFRSYESRADDLHESVKYKIAASPGAPALVATTGIPYLLPIRWNNPHSSEMEVNIWIMRKNNPVVVPIRKPACFGEGYQDAIMEFTIPDDFKSLKSKIVGFDGCQKVGDCVLQVYAHSVESRTYAIGIPLLVKNQKGGYDVTRATATRDILEPAGTDRGVSYSSLRPLCLHSNSPDVDITKCVPHSPRLVSDVFNHAYQDKDYSPYSGQQPEFISQNLQAAAFLKMSTSRRGELGYQLWKSTAPVASKRAIRLRRKADNLIKTYESITIQIIQAIGDKMKSNSTMKATDPNNPQNLDLIHTEHCFRCAAVGAVRNKRKNTNTYIPSFEIPATLLQEAAPFVAPAYGHLITVRDDGVGVLQIYNAVVQDMNEELLEASTKYPNGLRYQGAMLKTEKMATKSDRSQFKKRTPDDSKDNGVSAAGFVEEERYKNSIQVIANMAKKAMTGKPINVILCSGSSVTGLERISTTLVGTETDMDGLYMDCASDATNSGKKCPGGSRMKPGQLFPAEGQFVDLASSALGMTISWLSAFSLFVGVVFQL